MQTGWFTISGENCFGPVSEFIKKSYGVDYEKELNGGMLYCREDYVRLTGGRIMVAVTVEKTNYTGNHCDVEIIAGGGRFILLPITTGNEKRRVRKLYNLLVDFCAANAFEISMLEEQ